MLVSWLYALYSFDYRWSLARTRLPDRIHLFQTHSAFFLGKPAQLRWSARALWGMQVVHVGRTYVVTVCMTSARTSKVYVFLDASWVFFCFCFICMG